MKRVLVVGLLWAGWIGDTDAQVRAAGYAHGADHCYAFQAPIGWEMDTRTMAADGVPAAFHRPGEDWRRTWSFIYTRPVPKATGDVDPIRAQIDGIVEVYHKDSVPIAAEQVGTLHATLGAVGEVWEFTGHPDGSRELGVYFEGPRTINFFIAPVTKQADIEVVRRALFDIAESYEVRHDCVPCRMVGACNQ